jgi:histone-binding protein RBBP4
VPRKTPPSATGKLIISSVYFLSFLLLHRLGTNALADLEPLTLSSCSPLSHRDINNYSKTDNCLDPINTYRGHTSIVEDVAWHNESEWMFASVGDDRQLMIWDTREDGTDKPKQQVEAHSAEVNAVAFSPSSPNLLLTGSGDKVRFLSFPLSSFLTPLSPLPSGANPFFLCCRARADILDPFCFPDLSLAFSNSLLPFHLPQTIALWDLRKLSTPLHTFTSHTDEVIGLAWSPHSPTVFASSSSDRRINIWDIARIGEEQTPEDVDDGPPELMFVHGGHTSKPGDLSWNLQREWCLGSTAEDNIVMVWEPSQNIWRGDS